VTTNKRVTKKFGGPNDVTEKQRVLKLQTVLFKAFKEIEGRTRNDIRNYGLNSSEFGTLEYVYHKGKQPIQRVGERMLMANSSMTYVIDKLEKRNLVKRIESEGDRRITYVDLTEEGRTFFESIFKVHVQTLKDMYRVLEAEEQRDLIDLLKRIGQAEKK
jgi:MarR family transcriptional regulator, 2-MHQ and catechol-resistance regulon repressor